MRLYDEEETKKDYQLCKAKILADEQAEILNGLLQV